MKILYIGGSGRSGSTLMEMILGNIPGFFSLGEIKDFWELSERGDTKCGCGELINNCLFWNSIRTSLGYENHLISHLINLKQRIDRTRNLPFLPFLKLFANKEYNDLVNHFSHLYQIISEKKKGEILIDSSKTPSHLFLLSQIPGIDIRVLHLIRDPRAVAYSWNQRVKKETSRIQPEIRMQKRALVDSILRWSMENAYTQKLGEKQSVYSIIRYEDFVEDPSNALKKVLGELGLFGLDLSVLKSTSVELNSTHSIGGNPIRFQPQKHTIKNENSWENKMSSWQALTLGFLALPYIAKYKYPILRIKKESQW